MINIEKEQEIDGEWEKERQKKETNKLRMRERVTKRKWVR